MGHEGSRQEFLELLASQDEAPAFVRRTEDLEMTRQAVLAACQSARERLLEMPKLRLGQLHAHIQGDWSALENWLVPPDVLAQLRALYDVWQPQLRAPVMPTSSPDRWKQAYAELDQSFARFNRRWHEFLSEVDLGEINRLRENYNKWYVIEKACALGSDRLAAIGFRELDPMDAAEILRDLPYLPTASHD